MESDMRDGNLPPTLKTIAFMTGLSTTSVSRALSDAPDIGPETKERVRLVASQIGYQPNRAGLRLRTGRTSVLALVLNVDDEIMGFTSQMIFGISQALKDTGYNLIVSPSSHDSDPLLPVRNILQSRSADGVIIMRTAPDDRRVQLLLEKDFPFVTHGRTDSGWTHPFHDFDNESFVYQAVGKLAGRGRRRLAIIRPPRDLTYAAHIAAGLERGLRDFGMTEVPLPVSIDTPLLDVRAAMDRAMRAPEPPDAVLCVSASLAVAVSAGVEMAGKEIGKDLDIVSKQVSPALNWMRPEILTADEDVHLAGREMARALMARIAGADARSLQTLSHPVWKNPEAASHLR
jgi:LacI family transcriptional regulator